MTTWEVAQAFAALCRSGAFEAAGAQFWADDVASVEAMEGPMARTVGAAAVKAKGDWWNANHDVHSVAIEGPWPNGDQFALLFRMDYTPKGGARVQTDEIGLYTVREGRIVEERFFYPAA